MELHHQVFNFKDFSGQDLSGQDLSHSKFICCKFIKSDLTRSNCSHSDFTGSVLLDTKCTYTNFMNSILACTFKPRDAYGMTLTLSCKTFKGMLISRNWWYGFIFFALLMEPEKDKTLKLREGIINAIGKDRYERFKILFKNREI
jgi:uncharacterized protein YjbI with pentapeptide repeats